MQHGTVAVQTPEQTIVMAAGDTFTTPKGMVRSFRGLSSEVCTVFVLRGGDAPAMPRFVKLD